MPVRTITLSAFAAIVALSVLASAGADAAARNKSDP